MYQRDTGSLLYGWHWDSTSDQNRHKIPASLGTYSLAGGCRQEEKQKIKTYSIIASGKFYGEK